MKYAITALSLLLLPTAILAQSNYPPEMAGARVETFKSVEQVDLKAWIFEPDGHDASQSRPAVVFYFGGGFLRGSPSQFENQARYFASRGMVAITADYRVFNRNGTTLEFAVQDAKSAMRWVRSNASRLGVDPNRITAAGGSAGGQLAAAVALLPEHDAPNDDSNIRSTPDALVLFNPGLVFAPIGGRSDVKPLGGNPNIIGYASRESLSPYHHIGTENPPTIIFHGKADGTVPYSHSKLFTDAMLAAGNQAELVGYDGEDHGFFNFGRGDGSAYADILKRMDEFLVALGWLSEPQTAANYPKRPFSLTFAIAAHYRAYTSPI
jgi:acetyl esterase/lipase